MKHLLSATAVALALLPAAAQADEVTDLLNSALEAYEDGDIQYALEEIEFARVALLAMKTDTLGAFLPDAPDGWSREVNTEMSSSMGLMGGGVGAEAEYTGPADKWVKITLMADNPMVASVGAMVANAAVMGMKVERINRQRIAFQDDQAMALIGNRVLVQGEGDAEALRLILEEMNFRGMANFGN